MLAILDHDRRAAVVRLTLGLQSQPAQRVDQTPNRTLAHPGIAVEPKTSASQRQKSSQKTHRGSRSAHEQIGRPSRYNSAVPFHHDFAVLLVKRDRIAEMLQRG